MLEQMNLSMDDLFADIPAELICEKFNLPEPLSEMEVLGHLSGLAEKNSTHLTCFLGGGFYDHFIPSAVGAIISRSDFIPLTRPTRPSFRRVRCRRFTNTSR